MLVNVTSSVLLYAALVRERVLVCAKYTKKLESHEKRDCLLFSIFNNNFFLFSDVPLRLIFITIDILSNAPKNSIFRILAYLALSVSYLRNMLIVNEFIEVWNFPDVILYITMGVTDIQVHLVDLTIPSLSIISTYEDFFVVFRKGISYAHQTKSHSWLQMFYQSEYLPFSVSSGGIWYLLAFVKLHTSKRTKRYLHVLLIYLQCSK